MNTEKMYTKQEVIDIINTFTIDNGMRIYRQYYLEKYFQEKEYEKVDISDFHVNFAFQWRDDNGEWVDKVMDSLDYRVSATMSLHRAYMLYPNRFRKLKKIK